MGPRGNKSHARSGIFILKASKWLTNTGFFWTLTISSPLQKCLLLGSIQWFPAPPNVELCPAGWHTPPSYSSFPRSRERSLLPGNAPISLTKNFSRVAGQTCTAGKTRISGREKRWSLKKFLVLGKTDPPHGATISGQPSSGWVKNPARPIRLRIRPVPGIRAGRSAMGDTTTR